MAFPTKDSDLVPYSTNFNDRIVLSPGTFSLSAPQAAAYTPLHQAFLDSYQALTEARAAGTRSRSLVTGKDQAKFNLLRYGRELYRLVQASLTVSDANKELLGVRVIDNEPTPIPPPATAPAVGVLWVDGQHVRLRLSDPLNPTRKRLPDGVNGAIIKSFIGETPPADVGLFRLEGPVSRSLVDVIFPVSVEPGTKVWLTAAWFNERKQMGPFAAAVSTYINFGGSMTAAA